MKLRSAFLLLSVLAVTTTASSYPEPSWQVERAASCEAATPFSQQATMVETECPLWASALHASATSTAATRPAQRPAATPPNQHDAPGHECSALLGVRCDLDAAKYGRYGPSPTTIPPPVL